MIPGLKAFSGNQIASGTRVVTFLAWDHDNDGSFGGSTSWSFPGLSFGAAAGNRWIVVAIGARGSGPLSVSSCTIGGKTARIIATSTGSSGSSDMMVAIGIAYVPGGTSGTVAVTLNSGCSDCDVGLWSVTGITSSHMYDSDTDNSGAMSLTLDTRASGYLIAATAARNNLGASTTWTNATEVFDHSNDGIGFSAATVSTSGAAVTVSANFSGTAGQEVMAVITL